MALPGAGDIASIIAQRAANRKPMATSPTKKEFSDDAFRSNTISTSNSDQIQQARFVWLLCVWLCVCMCMCVVVCVCVCVWLCAFVCDCVSATVYV